jgi:hypothetical protein
MAIVNNKDVKDSLNYVAAILVVAVIIAVVAGRLM